MRYGPALTLLASLFFMWGFITVINNTLLPHLKSVFDLDYTQTTLIESVWRTLTTPGLRAVVSYGQPQSPEGRERREWVAELRAQVDALRVK